MKNFIEYIGDQLLALLAQNKEPVLVFPNKRPVAFLQNYVSQQAQKPIWFPKIFTIEEFVVHLTSTQIADADYTAACLYEIYAEVLQDQADSFDDFISWWNLMIADFNDIDMYMVPSEQLFNYINEVKLIEQWNLGEEQFTILQQKYLSFWKYLPIFYAQLNEKLNKENLGYRGMIYKKAAGKVNSTDFNFSAQTVIFAGFNALSTSEEYIVEYFLKNKKGFIYWESDDYYLKDENQEAGKFLRHYYSKWKHYDNSIFFGQHQLLNTPIEIKILGAPKSIMQAGLAGKLVNEIFSNQTLNSNLNAALIPADENQLHPLLYQLPAGHVNHINISMGYPISALPLKGLYEIIFDFIHQIEKDKQAVFSSNIILRILNHPYTAYLFQGDDNILPFKELQKLKHQILASGKIQYQLSELQKLQTGFEKIYFYWFFVNITNSYADLNKVISFLFEINHRLTSQHSGSIQQLQLHQVGIYNEIIERIDNTYFKNKITPIKQSKTLFTLIKQAIQSYTLPFLGNATDGLQCIGLLETRMLHFNEIIITGCNEGILPKAKASGNSFIPFDIRNQFNLPTYKDSEAVFAYHFYRVIQGAKKVYLIYNTETDEFGSGEKSRFLSQLEMELKQKNKLAKIKNEIIDLPKISGFKRKAISFEHNEIIDQNLMALCEKGLSATSLISFKNCSLQFYFKYLEQIKEPDSIADEVGANIVGSVIHKVLEEIYAPLKSTEIKKEQLQFTSEEIERMTTQAYVQLETGIDPNTGKNLLFIQTAVRIISRFLWYEIQDLKAGKKIKLLHTEVPLETKLEVLNNTVKLRGTVDRIDQWQQKIRIIDYKTGSVDPSKLKINSLEHVFENADYDKAFQLLFYTLLYQKNNPDTKQEIEAGILSLRKISEGIFSLRNELEMDNYLLEFERKLQLLIVQLLDTDVPFIQTEHIEKCAYCAYADICMK